jgi:N-acetylglucosaminyldiphosphoundecaprenol N-acetyl-beta-D-mannosaminyltransferase
MVILGVVTHIVTLFGVPIHALTQQQVLQRMHEYIDSSVMNIIATPNNEILLKALHSPAFTAVLQATTLNIPDSTGVLLAAKYLGHTIPERVTGIDTMTQFCTELDADTPVFLLGAAEGIAHKAAHALQLRNQDLIIAGTYCGSPALQEQEYICTRITQSGAKVLFVAFGAPYQEEWLLRNVQRLPNVRIGMGVGGSFDFLAGTVKRAPILLRRCGLEWAWRLFIQPKRLPRIWNATVVFAWRVVRSAT